MTTLREAAQQALDALEVATTPRSEDRQTVLKAQAALREALAQPEPEPAAWLLEAYDINEHKTLKRLVFERPNVNPGIRITPYYTHPPQRKPLTNGKIYTAYITATNQTLRSQDERLALAFARAIERAHGIGGEE